MARQCVFCGGSPVTKEHLWPRWGRRFATDPTFDRYAMRTDHSKRGTTTRSWGGPPFSKRAGVACSACNSGWMASLEAEVSEILDPAQLPSRVATTAEAATLAVWAAKTAIVFDAASPAADRLLRPDVGQAVYATHTPPAEAEIWMTAYRGDRPHFLDMRAVDLDDRFDPARGWRQVVAIAWSIGPFAFAYCSSTVPGILRAVGRPPAPRSVDLWPARQDRWRWRPEKALMTDDDLIQFAEYLPAKVAAVEHWPLALEHTAAGSLM